MGLKYHQYQDIEAEVEEFMETWLTKKLIATTVSSRNVEIKRRNEGMTMSSHKKTRIYKDQEDEKTNGKGGGRQKFKHVDGDFPLCMRSKDEKCELKMRKTEKLKGRGGGRQKLRHVDGDVPMSMRSKEDERESKSKEKEKGSSSKTKSEGSSKKKQKKRSRKRKQRSEQQQH